MEKYLYTFQDATGVLRLPMAYIQTREHRSYRDYTQDESRLAPLRWRLRVFGLQSYHPLYIVVVPAAHAEVTEAQLAAITLFSRLLELFDEGQARSPKQRVRQPTWLRRNVVGGVTSHGRCGAPARSLPGFSTACTVPSCARRTRCCARGSLRLLCCCTNPGQRLTAASWCALIASVGVLRFC